MMAASMKQLFRRLPGTRTLATVRISDRAVENIIRGHKAAINNPNVSKEAKENSRQLLGSYDESLASFGKTKSTKSASTGHKDPGNVARGLKATINNPKVSLEAKERAQEKLDHM